MRVFAPEWEWARLERVWCQVSASVFPTRRWFPAEPLSFLGRWRRRAFKRSLVPVRRARVFVPEQESAHRAPMHPVRTVIRRVQSC